MEGLGAAHRTSLQRQEEQQELERLRWKNTMDQKDTRLHMLEQACRDRDAEKIQRIANAVSGCCVLYLLQWFLCWLVGCRSFSHCVPVLFGLFGLFLVDLFLVDLFVFCGRFWFFQTMTMDELQGSLNYALRKCFTDARYKFNAPVVVPTSNPSNTNPSSPSQGIGQKLSQSGGSSNRRRHSPRNSPRNSSPRGSNSPRAGQTTIVARPYQSVKDEEGGSGGSGGSNSDEIVVMSDDNSSDEIAFDEDDNTSVEF